MIDFIYGATFMGYAIASIFFLRFWRSTRDRLFAMFSGAFFLLAGQRIALLIYADNAETTPVIYLFRLVAYLLILVAILDKNRARAR